MVLCRTSILPLLCKALHNNGYVKYIGMLSKNYIRCY